MSKTSSDTAQTSPGTAHASLSNGKGAGTVFALLIGINDYLASDGLPPLRGAVHDARAMEKYLLDTYDERGLHVPPPNIVVLENEKATRANMLSAFNSHFLHNENIPDGGDASMIFFFAGHGSRAKAPGNLISRDETVETICPVDERTTNDAGEYVHTIPDYVMGWLLWELSEKKGPNITVILDSCNSGGMGRDIVGRARSALTNSQCIPPALDNHLWNGKTDSVISYRMWHSLRASHVLLAACGAREIAQEVPYEGIPRGRFTASLIHLLRWVPPKNTTYTDLISQMPVWSGQNPHCGGSRRNRLIFDGNYPITGRVAVPLTLQDPPNPKTDPEGAEGTRHSSQLFRVKMGALDGVVPGTEFAAYDANNNLLCIFVAQSVKVAETNLIAKEGDRQSVLIPPGSVVRVLDWKNDAMILRVYIPDDFQHKAHLFPKVWLARRPRFVQAPSPQDAHFIIRSTGDELVLEPCTDMIRKAQKKMRFPLKNPAHLPDCVDGVAHFSYFLGRANKEDPIMGFALEMHRLLGNIPDRKPDQNGNMIVDNMVRFASEPGAKYGFTMCNTSPNPLFPYLFYFDPETLTIQDWYLPEGWNAAPPLQSKGTVTLGMGGERAFEFTLQPGEKESSGFLKLFVSHQYIDLEWIKQTQSPFDPDFEGNERLDVGREKLDRYLWDALTVTLTMTRSGG